MIPKKPVTIALAQLTPAVGDPATNMSRALDAVARAGAAGADLLLLPELHLQGYRADDLFAVQAEPLGGPAVTRLVEAARQADLYAVLGLARADEAFPHCVYNTAVMVGPEGVVGHYDKIHLGSFHPFTEGTYFAPGRSAPVFPTRLGPVSLQICYDASFPELTRLYALKGSVLNLVISAGPSAARESWAVTLRQRAKENLMWTAYCNTVGPQKDFSFFGGSKIVDPRGQIVAEASFEEEDFLVHTIDLEEAFELRRRRLALRDVSPAVLAELAAVGAGLSRP